MIPDITINDQSLKEMTEEILSPLDEALAQTITESATPCVAAAKDFLTSIRISYEELVAANKIAKHQNELKKAIENPDNDVIHLSDEYNRNKQILKEMFIRTQIVDINIKMENFSKELNNFLNQKSILTYVYTNRKGNDPIVFLVDDIGQIMKKGMGSRGTGIKTRINMTVKQAKQALKNGNSAIQQLSEENYMTTLQIKNLKSSYNEVINRYNKYKYQVKNGKEKMKTIHVIIWRPQLDYKVVIMGNNAGDIKQAYVNALINRTGFISEELEKNIDDFMKYISMVGATPGMLQGDVSQVLSNGNTIEYAVKSADASFMSLQLAIDLAIEILMAIPPFDIEQLKKKKIQYAKNINPRNKQITLQTLQDLFDGTIPDEIKIDWNI